MEDVGLEGSISKLFGNVVPGMILLHLAPYGTAMVEDKLKLVF
jgi:hypothetical protein